MSSSSQLTVLHRRPAQQLDGRKVGDAAWCDKGFTVVDVIAHRGACRQAGENTVEAFRRAVELGADGIELDVRRTADGVLVVHHDAIADGRPIIETPRADLPEHVPTLAAAVDACSGAWVNVEIKNDPADPDFDPDDGVAAAVVAELAERDPRRLMFSSFRLETVDRCRQLTPDVPTAWLVVDVDDDRIARNVRHGHPAINPWERELTADVIERCRSAGLEVYAWTCNDPGRAVDLATWGVSGIITDVPDVIRTAISRPG
jgi:glycerophosphoryl diester phosphodiesterase